MCNNKMQYRYDDGWSIYFNIALALTARTEQYVVATCMAIKLMAVGSVTTTPLHCICAPFVSEGALGSASPLPFMPVSSFAGFVVPSDATGVGDATEARLGV